MLVLHSSSRCDVCMDAYTFQSIAQTPHAIPCGHIFCRPCLFALSPLICPLCRKRFDPIKAKRLHVDRPETVDENREIDLLQRMAISAEAPEDQLQELLNEVDAWLDSRADETCLVLRQARATSTRYLELKKLGPSLEGALADFQTRFEDMTVTRYAEHQERTKLEADNNALISENEDLKAQVEELRSISEQYDQRRNPLPPPPQPIPTEYVPSFSQALAHDQPFKIQHKYHKGKARSLDRRLASPSPSQNPPPLPTQQAKIDPSEESPALVSHLDHHSPYSRQHLPSPAPPSGLKLHFENTNQPLDAFELTQTYLREYSQGVLDGKLMAGKHPWTSHQPRASTSRMHSDVSSLHDRSESIDSRSFRSNRSNQVRETQPVSGSSMVDPPSRPLHQRHNTVASLLTSPESSTGSGSQTRSGSRRPNPTLADLLSNDAPIAPQPRRPIPSLPTTPPIPNPNDPIPSQLSPQGQQIESVLQSSFQIQTRAGSPASSRMSKASTWGTLKSTSTNHTIYSLLGNGLALRDFRENFAVSPPQHNGGRIDSHRASHYSLNSLNSWHGSTASSLSPMSQTQDQFSSTNGYHQHEGGDENAIRRDENTTRRDESAMRRDESAMRRDESAMRRDEEVVNPSYSRDSRDSTGSRRQRPLEPQRMRGRNQPLPALSPSSSFSYGEAIITEDSSDSSNFMTFGNALGLELSTDPIPISAPTPVVPHRTFLRSFSGSDES